MAKEGSAERRFEFDKDPQKQHMVCIYRLVQKETLL